MNIIASAICSVRNGDLYSPFLKYFSSPLALPMESDYHGFDEGLTKVRSFLHTFLAPLNFYQPDKSTGWGWPSRLTTTFLDLLLRFIVRSLMEAASTYPAPSDYAHHTVWSERQEDDTAILCHRPTIHVCSCMYRLYVRFSTSRMTKCILLYVFSPGNPFYIYIISTL
jgi:hypothetical protein